MGGNGMAGATYRNKKRLERQVERVRREYVEVLTDVAQLYRQYLDNEAFADATTPGDIRLRDIYRGEMFAEIVQNTGLADVERRYQEAIRRYREARRGQRALF